MGQNIVEERLFIFKRRQDNVWSHSLVVKLRLNRISYQHHSEVAQAPLHHPLDFEATEADRTPLR